MAVAGSVAPVFRAEGYVASATYDFYHAIIHNNKLYFCRQDGTIGHEPQEESDEYWFLSLDGNFADAASLGGETAEQWQTKLDNIQTTSRATLSQAGWYRVAGITGATGNTVILKVGNVFANSGSDEDLLLFTYSYANAEFSTISSKNTNAVPIFSKARYTVEGETFYLEVYFSINTYEPVACTVLSFPDWDGNSWKALPFVATSETVDGVTVTTTYDIPANASPVTTVDTSGMVFLNELPNGITNDSTMQELINAMPDNSFLHCRVGKPLVPEDFSVINVFKYANNRVLAFAKSQYTKNISIGGISTSNVWEGWNEHATTADLANYLPVNGGMLTKGSVLAFERPDDSTLSGHLGVGFYGNSLEIWERGGTNRGIKLDISKCDNTNGSEFLHSGNVGDYALPISGGTVKGAYGGLGVQNTNNGADYAFIDFKTNDNPTLGSIGVQNGKPIFAKDGIFKEMLHTGNKPSGTYTGNGSAEPRTIVVEGIGQAIQISSVHGIAFVYGNVAVAIDSNGNGKFYSGGSCVNFAGNFGMWTDENVFNASGVTYYYQVL